MSGGRGTETTVLLGKFVFKQKDIIGAKQDS